MSHKSTFTAALMAFVAVTAPLIGLQDESTADKAKEPEMLAFGDLRVRAQLTEREGGHAMLVILENPTDEERTLQCELRLSMMPGQDDQGWSERMGPRPRLIQTRAVDETIPARTSASVLVALPEGVRVGKPEDLRMSLYSLTLGMEKETGINLANFRGRVEATQVKAEAAQVK